MKAEIMGQIGAMKGDIGTLKWQVAILLAIALGGGGSVSKSGVVGIYLPAS